MVQTCILCCTDMAWPPYCCNDHKSSYFTVNISNGYVDSFEILFEASSQACSAILPTIRRPGLKLAHQ